MRSLADILACDDSKLFTVRNFGKLAHAEIIQLRQQWAKHTGLIEGDQRENGLLVQTTSNVALEQDLLPTRHPPPTNPLIGIETIRFLLQIGCPLGSISAERMTANHVARQMLAHQELHTALRVCLADHDQLSNVMKDAFAAFQADVTYYVEWLCTQSDWDHEVRRSQPSPVVLWHLRQIPLSRLIELCLADLSERARRLVMLRFGLTGEQDRTLQEVADMSGVTRERVRQVCKKALEQVRSGLSRYEVVWAFLYYCGEFIHEVEVIEPASLLKEISEQIIIDLEHPDGAVIFLLENAGLAKWSKATGLLVSPTLPENAIGTVLSSVREQLVRAKAPIRLGTLVANLGRLRKSERHLLETNEFVEKCLRASANFVNVEEDYWGLLSWENHIVDDIVMVLRKLNRPAHFTEITELTNRRLRTAQPAHSRAVHGTLGRLESLFVRTGPGTFALRELYPELPVQPTKFIDLIEKILQEANRPLTSDEIFELVNKQREAKRTSIVMYLSMHERFTYFGKNTYGLRSWQASLPNSDNIDADHIASLPEDFLERLKSQAMSVLPDEQLKTGQGTE